MVLKAKRTFCDTLTGRFINILHLGNITSKSNTVCLQIMLCGSFYQSSLSFSSQFEDARIW